VGRRLRSHLSEHVVGYLALFITVGGTSYAAARLPANSVGTAQLRKGAVTAPKLAKRAVDTTKVKNATLVAADFAPGQIPQGSKGATGPQGATGPTGAKGDPGPAGVTDILLATGSSGSDGSSPKFARAACPAGYSVVGGGFTRTGETTAPIFLDDSSVQGSRAFTPPLGGWIVSAHAQSGYTNAWSIQAVAICMSVS
jgi:hypothetical protein